MSLRRKAVIAAILATLVAGSAPATSHAGVDPEGCTATLGYNPDIPTWEQYFAAHPNPNAILPFAAGSATAGGGAPANGIGSPPTGRNLTSVIYDYWDGMVALTANDERTPDGSYKFPYQLIKKVIGTSFNGRPYSFYVLATRENIASLDAGANDAAFWRGVRAGTISTEQGLEAAGTRPAFAWVTAAPHGSETAAGESITRNLYELLSRTDCENARRMQVLDLFMMPVRNPDGRDAVTRTTAWGFDPNRDVGTQNQVENGRFVPLMNEYPGVFFIDAHQQGGRGYFFPPNEDPVHHEISNFALTFIQNIVGPALQNAFNDQSDYYTNYLQYDLFTPEYGDTVPSLLMGAAGMTFEKGNANIYSRQVYDHYLAIDTTINVTANSKFSVLSNWVRQWGEAVQQGRNCQLQENKLVSPLHDTIEQQPQGTICGYFFKPTQHTGDMAALIDLLQRTGVRVWRLDTPVAVDGYHEYGKTNLDGQTLPAGTLWIPLDQGTKHWINAVLEENPWLPYSYYYDVVTWSYPLNRGLAGSGFVTKPMSPGVQMTEVHNPTFGTFPSTASPVYAFNTDSMQGLGLVADLLAKGVNVYRAKSAFDSRATHFYTGAALVDGTSLAGKADLAALAAARDTPVTALANYPVARYQLTAPKIGVYTGSATVPSYPFNRVGTQDGHCGLTSNATGFCEAVYTLAVKDKIPRDLLVPVTSADLAAGKLVTDHFTALINPGQTSNGAGLTTGTNQNPQDPCPTFVANPNGQALQAFVNAGGIYVANTSGGYNSARCLLTPTAPKAISNLLTPGSTFDATIDTTNPVGWGFDLGGWIYRDSGGNPVWDKDTLGTGQAVVSFAPSVRTNPGHYGYETNAAELAGTPAVIDAPSGAGHAILLGFNPFFRAWKEHDERLVLNAALYPIGAEIPPSAPSAETAQPAPTIDEVTPASEPLPAAKLRSLTSHASAPDSAPTRAADRDVRIRVKRADAAKLKAAVKTAKLSRSIRKKISYTTSKTTVTLIVKGVRTNDEHARRAWVSRIQNGLKARNVRPIFGIV